MVLCDVIFMIFTLKAGCQIQLCGENADSAHVGELMSSNRKYWTRTGSNEL